VLINQGYESASGKRKKKRGGEALECVQAQKEEAYRILRFGNLVSSLGIRPLSLLSFSRLHNSIKAYIIISGN